ncbi:MAG: hypothetical protein ACPGVK_11480, partial [Halocynthiibacter sp.]
MTELPISEITSQASPSSAAQSVNRSHDGADIKPPRTSMYMRVVVGLILVVAAITLWVSNSILTKEATKATQGRAELRLALYSGSLMGELRRAAVVPQLLARDRALIGALNSSDYTNTSQRLISFRDEISSSTLILLDASGRVVAATERNLLGQVHRRSHHFIEALRSIDTVFSIEDDSAGLGFAAYS